MPRVEPACPSSLSLQWPRRPKSIWRPGAVETGTVRCATSAMAQHFAGAELAQPQSVPMWTKALVLRRRVVPALCDAVSALHSIHEDDSSSRCSTAGAIQSRRDGRNSRFWQQEQEQEQEQGQGQGCFADQRPAQWPTAVPSSRERSEHACPVRRPLQRRVAGIHPHIAPHEPACLAPWLHEAPQRSRRGPTQQPPEHHS
jgi:hypothetical protein